jgi:hypothetical protein
VEKGQKRSFSQTLSSILSRKTVKRSFWITL